MNSSSGDHTPSIGPNFADLRLRVGQIRGLGRTPRRALIGVPAATTTAIELDAISFPSDAPSVAPAHWRGRVAQTRQGARTRIARATARQAGTDRTRRTDVSAVIHVSADGCLAELRREVIHRRSAVVRFTYVARRIGLRRLGRNDLRRR